MDGGTVNTTHKYHDLSSVDEQRTTVFAACNHSTMCCVNVQMVIYRTELTTTELRRLICIQECLQYCCRRNVVRSSYFLVCCPFYFFLSFIGFTYFLLLSIPSLSTRIVPLRFQAGGGRRRPNLGLVCLFVFFYVICVICIP